MTSKLGGLFKTRRRRRAKLEHEKAPINPRTKLLVRLLLGAVILAASVLFFPLTVAFNPPTYIEGSIAGEEILAPFPFDVSKPPSELDLERARAAQQVLPVFVPVRQGPTSTRRSASLMRLETIGPSSWAPWIPCSSP
jgi:hypothetical protein